MRNFLKWHSQQIWIYDDGEEVAHCDLQSLIILKAIKGLDGLLTIRVEKFLSLYWPSPDETKPRGARFTFFYSYCSSFPSHHFRHWFLALVGELSFFSLIRTPKWWFELDWKWAPNLQGIPCAHKWWFELNWEWAPGLQGIQYAHYQSWVYGILLRCKGLENNSIWLLGLKSMNMRQ